MRPAVIIVGAIVLGAAVSDVVGSNHYYYASAIKVAMGQRFFPDGTGVAFFDDGTTQTFFHSVTPRNGYYYDNSTVFFAGMIPGFNDTFITINPSLLGTNDKFSYTPYYDDNNSTIIAGTSSGGPHHNTTTIRIPNGFTLQLGAQKFQPNIVRVHPGDIVTWANDDYQKHTIISPPTSSLYEERFFPGATAPQGQNFMAWNINPGGTFSILIPPIVGGGYHFNDPQFKNATGAIIVGK